MIKYSMRVNGSVTSVNIPKPVIALYLTAIEDVPSITGLRGKDILQDFILDRISEITLAWTGEKGKGLSSFIIDQLIQSILEGQDLQKYRTVLDEVKKAA